MSFLAIATYRPLPGKEAEFDAVLAEHLPTLRAAGLVTERSAYRARSNDGTIVEVFEWKDEMAKNAAHRDPSVRAVWGRFEGLCEIRPLTATPEAQAPFANYEIKA